MSLQPVEVDVGTAPDVNADDVTQFGVSGHRRAAMPNLYDIIWRGQYAFSEQEPYRQFVVVTRRAHRHRDGLLVAAVRSLETNANFERFLDRDLVVCIVVAPRPNTPNFDALTASRRCWLGAHMVVRYAENAWMPV